MPNETEIPGLFGGTYDGIRFNSPERGAEHFEERLLEDLQFAAYETANNPWKRDLLDKFNEAYGIKSEGLSDEDVQNLVKLSEGTESETGDGLLAGVLLIDNGANEELVKAISGASKIEEVGFQKNDGVKEPVPVIENNNREVGRNINEISEDLKIAAGKRSEVTDSEREIAKQRLEGDGVNIDNYVYQGNPDTGSDDGKRLVGNRRKAIRDLADNLPNREVTEEQMEIIQAIGLDTDSYEIRLGGEHNNNELENLIQTYEEHYNERFLRRRGNEVLERDNISDHIDAKNLLEVAGYPQHLIDLWERRIAAGDDYGSIDEMHAEARTVYLKYLLGERLDDFQRVAMEIQRLKSDAVDTQKKESVLKTDISGEANRVADERGWNETMRKRLVNFLKNEYKLYDVDLEKALRELELIRGLVEPRKQKEAATKWMTKYGLETDLKELQEMQAEVGAFAGLKQEEISIVYMGEGEARLDMVAEIRMAMLEELGSEKVHTGMNIRSSFESFVRVQATKYGGYGKALFPEDFQKELEVEFTARAELAKLLAYWDASPSLEEEAIKTMPLLSRSTYDWLSRDTTNSKLVYMNTNKERVEVDLRAELNKAGSRLYMDMVAGNIDIWNSRGEDRIAKIEGLVEKYGVSLDAVRLVWQLAEAECWQARQEVGHVSHPAGKLVVFSDFREFNTRKAKKIPGGNRLWQEYLLSHNGSYPPEGTNIYAQEGSRLARVGFEAWSIKIAKTGDTRKVPGIRAGQVWLYPQSNPILTDQLYQFETDGKSFSLRSDGSRVAETTQIINSEMGDKAAKVNAVFTRSLGGESALFSGEYFSRLEAFLNQPAIIDSDLPQRIVRDDLAKAAAVVKAIDTIGDVEAGKASTVLLGNVRDTFTALKFRTNSNDVFEKDGESDTYRERYVNVRGKWKRWNIPDGTTERMAKARAEAGMLLEQWSRSYIWLLSWENPSHQNESKVVGMGEWIRLVRNIALSYDQNRHWGQYLGYGYGNYDVNELATNERGGRRFAPTGEMREAVEGYKTWFKGLFYRIAEKIQKKQIPFETTRKRVEEDENALKDYTFNLTYWSDNTPFGVAWWKGVRV